MSRLLRVLVVAAVAIGAVFYAAEHATVHATIQAGGAQLASTAVVSQGELITTSVTTPGAAFATTSALSPRQGALEATSGLTGTSGYIAAIDHAAWDMTSDPAEDSHQGPVAPAEHHHIDIDPLAGPGATSTGTGTTTGGLSHLQAPTPVPPSFSPYPD